MSGVNDPAYVGIDVGTQSARCVICTAGGEVLAEGASPLPASAAALPGRAEQDAEDWWRAVLAAVGEATAGWRQACGPEAALGAVCVDSTSGTVIPVDAGGKPLRPAIMYNDMRATEEAQIVSAAGAELEARLGYRFSPAFALPKLLWVQRHEPHTFAATARFLHAADFVLSRLTGRTDVTDTSNALKTGADLLACQWPSFIGDGLGLPLSLLPELHRPGEVVGMVTAGAAAATGLLAGTPVAVGCTDGTAAFLASGASEPGEANSTLGTTLVVRGVSAALVRDPLGRVYCHLHPDGLWLPGGASSCGGEVLERWFAHDYQALEAGPLALPSAGLLYPLPRRGERLPFVHAAAEGFWVREPGAREERFVACLEGVALVERWCYEVLEQLGMPWPQTLHATGGAARSDPWLRIRASALGLSVARPRRPDSAFGAAVLAASAEYGSVREATRAMVRVESRFEPDPGLVPVYAERLGELRAACVARGYVAEA